MMNNQSNEIYKPLKGVIIHYHGSKAYSKPQKDEEGNTTIMSSSNFEPAFMSILIKVPKVNIFCLLRSKTVKDLCRIL